MTLGAFNRWKASFIGFDVIDETELTKCMATINEGMGKAIKIVADMASKHIGELFISNLIL